MSNLVNAFTGNKILALLAFCLFYSFSTQAQDLPYTDSKQYTIRDIKVTGTVTFNEQTVLA